MKEFLVIRDAQKFKEASEPTRQKILQLLSIKELSVDELAKLLEKDVSTIYRHISKLVAIGFVEIAREEQVGSVSKRYYRRVAKLIIGIFPSEEIAEIEILQKELHEKIRRGLLALSGFRYNIKDDASLDRLVKIATDWYRLCNSSVDNRIIEEKMVGDISAYNIALKLLVLVETRDNPTLRKATELLVSELAKRRENM